MGGPDFFLLFMIAGILALVLAACMLTGAVWLFFGWRKKCRSVQFLSALPFGVGVLVVAPLLFLVLLFTGFCLIAGAWGGRAHTSNRSPNQPVERIAAGGRLSQLPAPSAASLPGPYTVRVGSASFTSSASNLQVIERALGTGAAPVSVSHGESNAYSLSIGSVPVISLAEQRRADYLSRKKKL